MVGTAEEFVLLFMSEAPGLLVVPTRAFVVAGKALSVPPLVA